MPAPVDATYILKNPNASLPNAIALSTVGNGLLKNASGTPTAAVPNVDYLAVNSELLSIAELSPPFGALLVALGSEAWGFLEKGSAGQGLMATAETIEWQSLPPLVGSYITLNNESGLPNARRLNVGAGLHIEDYGANSEIIINTTGFLNSVNNLATVGLMVHTNSGSGLATRMISSSDDSLTVTNPTGAAGNIDLSINDDVSFQKLNLSRNGTLVGSRSKLNFVSTPTVGVTLVDDGVNNKVDVVLTASPGTSTFAPMTTEVVTENQVMEVNKRYIANSAALVTLTLPATAAVGAEFIVGANNSGGWRVNQNANQQIRWGTLESTEGTDGYALSQNVGDVIHLVCVEANTTFLAMPGIGNYRLE